MAEYEGKGGHSRARKMNVGLPRDAPFADSPIRESECGISLSFEGVIVGLRTLVEANVEMEAVVNTFLAFMELWEKMPADELESRTVKLIEVIWDAVLHERDPQVDWKRKVRDLTKPEV